MAEVCSPQAKEAEEDNPMALRQMIAKAQISLDLTFSQHNMAWNSNWGIFLL